MALSRKLLQSFGLEEEKIDAIIDAHMESVGFFKSENNRLTEELGKYSDYNELKEKVDSNTTLQSKYDALKQEYSDYKKGVEYAETRTGKINAYKDKLINAGVDNRRIDSIVRITDIDGLNIDEVTDESIKNDWADFIISEKVETPKIDTPIDNIGGGISKEAFKKMSYSERAALFTENRELYDELANN